MTLYCHACGSRNIRPSRLQLKDVGYFLILRYPVRCRHCRKRSSVSIFRIGVVRSEADARIHREEYEAHRKRTSIAGGQKLKDQS